MRLDKNTIATSRAMKNRLAYVTSTSVETEGLQKTVVSQAMRRRSRKFFDSADWILNGLKNESALPIAHKEKDHEAASTKREKLPIQEVDIKGEIKWNEEIKVDQESPVAQRAIHTGPIERKYFDSADWALGKDTVHTFHTYRNFPQPIPTHVVAQKRLHKSRKYFDSADWQLSGGVPQLYPKLNVLKN